MTCERYTEIVAAHADGALPGDEARAADAHVEACAACAAQRQAQIEMRERLRRHPAPAMPEHLRQRVLANLRDEMQKAPPAGEARSDNVRPLFTKRRTLLIGAIAASIALLLLPRGHDVGQPDLFRLLVQDAHAADAGDIEFALRSHDVADLRHYFETEGVSFQDTVPDLGARGYAPQGATADTYRGTLAALTVYEGEGGKVVCRRFAAGAIEIPAGGERFGDAIVVTMDGVTMRFVRDGDALCCLASTMPREQFLRTFGLTG